ncbi:MAG: biopolymer transporter ExbD [Patescibacteria group bacterium]|nr:biopolymer transporter ExbD [Patescibacteria group bacterium]
MARKKRIQGGAAFAEGDMTPMIDMTFQLIAFFMVLINFTEADQNERIRLPISQLAKPPDQPIEDAITLQLTQEGTILLGGDEFSLDELQNPLRRERQVLENTPGKSVTSATIVIRAHMWAKAGRVQEVIEVCQKTGFERFALRAKQAERGERT